MYGKLRRTDSLPVGEEREDEVLDRGWDSATSSSDSEHGLQNVGRSALTESEEEGTVSSAASSVCGIESRGMNPLAGSPDNCMSDRDAADAELDADYL